MARTLFPTAPASLLAEVEALEHRLVVDLPPGIASRSTARGRPIAGTIDSWSRSDGGHGGYLHNFPTDYIPPAGQGLWVATPPANVPALQPYWGANRCMALRSGADGDPGPHPAFSVAQDSAFFAEALEVYDTVNDLTAEQRAIALFWG